MERSALRSCTTVRESRRSHARTWQVACGSLRSTYFVSLQPLEYDVDSSQPETLCLSKKAFFVKLVSPSPTFLGYHYNDASFTMAPVSLWMFIPFFFESLGLYLSEEGHSASLGNRFA